MCFFFFFASQFCFERGRKGGEWWWSQRPKNVLTHVLLICAKQYFVYRATIRFGCISFPRCLIFDGMKWKKDWVECNRSGEEEKVEPEPRNEIRKFSNLRSSALGRWRHEKQNIINHTAIFFFFLFCGFFFSCQMQYSLVHPSIRFYRMVAVAHIPLTFSLTPLFDGFQQMWPLVSYRCKSISFSQMVLFLCLETLRFEKRAQGIS